MCSPVRWLHLLCFFPPFICVTLFNLLLKPLCCWKTLKRHLRGMQARFFFWNTAGGYVKIAKKTNKDWMVLATGRNAEYLSSLVPYPVVHLDIGLQEHILKEGSRNNNSLLLPSQRSLRVCFFSSFAYYRMILQMRSQLKMGAISWEQLSAVRNDNFMTSRAMRLIFNPWINKPTSS